MTVRVLITHDQERYHRALDVRLVHTGTPMTISCRTIVPGDTQEFWVAEGTKLEIVERHEGMVKMAVLE